MSKKSLIVKNDYVLEEFESGGYPYVFLIGGSKVVESNSLIGIRGYLQKSSLSNKEFTKELDKMIAKELLHKRYTEVKEIVFTDSFASTDIAPKSIEVSSEPFKYKLNVLLSNDVMTVSFLQ